MSKTKKEKAPLTLSTAEYKKRATTAMVLGILSILLILPTFGVVTFILSIIALSKVKRLNRAELVDEGTEADGDNKKKGKAFITAAKITAIIGLILSILVLIGDVIAIIILLINVIIALGSILVAAISAVIVAIVEVIAYFVALVIGTVLAAVAQALGQALQEAFSQAFSLLSMFL